MPIKLIIDLSDPSENYSIDVELRSDEDISKIKDAILAAVHKHARQWRIVDYHCEEK